MPSSAREPLHQSPDVTSPEGEEVGSIFQIAPLARILWDPGIPGVRSMGLAVYQMLKILQIRIWEIYVGTLPEAQLIHGIESWMLNVSGVLWREKWKESWPADIWTLCGELNNQPLWGPSGSNSDDIYRYFFSQFIGPLHNLGQSSRTLWWLPHKHCVANLSELSNRVWRWIVEVSNVQSDNTQDKTTLYKES